MLKASYLKTLIDDSLPSSDIPIEALNEMIGKYPSDVNFLLQRCAYFLKLKQYDNAGNDCSLIINNFPNHFYAYNKALLFDSYIKIVTDLFDKASDEIVEVLNTIKGFDLELSDLYYLLAMSKNYLEDFESCLNYCDMALQLNPTEIEILALKANAIAHLRMPDEAFQMFDCLINQNPDEPTIYTRRAEIYDLQGDYEKALLDLNHAIEIDPNSDHYLERGDYYEKHEQLAEALHDFTKAIEIEPVYRTFSHRSSFYKRHNNPVNSMKDFNQAIKLVDNEQDCQLEELISRNDKKRKIICLNRVIEMNPSAQNYLKRSVYYLKQQNFKKALKDVNRSIKILPLSIAYAVRGLNYQQNGNTFKALNDYNKAIELDDTNANHYILRAQLYSELNDYEKALNDYNKATQLDNTKSSIFFNRAQLFTTLNQYGKALNDCNKAIELDDTNANHYIFRAQLYIELNDYEKALNDYNKAIELDNTNANYYLQRGLVHQSLYDFEKAEIDLKQAINYTNSQIAYKRLAYVQTSMKKYDEAISMINKWELIDPDNTEIVLFKAMYYNEKKDFKTALSLCEETIKMHPDLFWTYLFKLEIYEKQKLYHEALTFSNEIVERLKHLYQQNNSINKEECNFIDSSVLFNMFQATRAYLLLHFKEEADAYQEIIDCKNLHDYLDKKQLNRSIQMKVIFYNFNNLIKRTTNIWIESTFTFFHRLLILFFNFDKTKHSNAIFEELMSVLDKMPYIEVPLADGLLPLMRRILGPQTNPADFTAHFKKVGKEIFNLEARMAILRYIIREINKEKFSGISSSFSDKEFQQMMDLFINLEEAFEKKNKELIEDHEKQVAEAKLKAKDEIIQSFSHKMKNTFPKAIAAIENVFEDYRVRGVEIPQELEASKKQIQRIEKIAHSINFSFKGSIDDVRFDTSQYDNAKNMKQIIVEAIETGIENILDKTGIYADFSRGYFDLKTKKLARTELHDVRHRSLEFLQSLLTQYFFDLEFEPGVSDSWMIGNNRHTLTKFTEIFDELIFNAIKYSSTIERCNRKIILRLTEETNKIIFELRNNCQINENTPRTTGIGLEIIKNTLSSLQIPFEINKSPDFFSIRIEFDHYWKPAQL